MKTSAPQLSRLHFSNHLPRKQWLRVGEVAEYIGFGESFVYKLLDSGTLHGHKHNAATGATPRWRIRAESVLIYLMDTADYEPEDVLICIAKLLRQRSPEEIEFILKEVQSGNRVA